MWKKFFRSRPVQFILAVVLAGYVRLVNRSIRWQVHGQEIVDPIWQKGEGVIGALWHSRILLTLAAWPPDRPPKKQSPSFLISLSPDGAFVSRAALFLGSGVIRGSGANRKKKKNKGGATAFRKMIDHIQAGGCLAITPDGPRGPRMRASLGAIVLAAKTGAPVLCLGVSCSRAKFFNSWDRFCLPIPFGRGAIVWKGPVWVPKDADEEMLERKRQEVEDLINQASFSADSICDHLPIEPAEREES